MKSASKASRPPATPSPGLREYWIFGAVLFGLAVAVIPLDRVLAEPGISRSLPGDVERLVTLSELFAHGFGVAIVVIGIWLLVAPKRRLIPRIVTCVVWPAIIVNLLKISFGRFRPRDYIDASSQANYPLNMTETWLGWMPDDKLNLASASQSFPSAHAATTWGLAIGMSWAFPKGRWLFFTIAILASVQRVSSFAHWPSDVFCGAAIAVVAAAAITQNRGLGYYFGRYENQIEATSEIELEAGAQSQVRKVA